MASKPIREGFQSVVPFLSVQAAASLVEFLCAGLGAKQTFESKSGTHFEVKIGDSMVMIGDVGDQTPTTGQLFMYVEDLERHTNGPFRRERHRLWSLRFALGAKVKKCCSPQV